MDAKTSLKNRLPSRHVTEGPARAPHRSYYYAMGLTKEQIHQPFVGVASCWNEAAPCNIALMRQAQAVKKGVAAAHGTPREFCTITVTDGIAMGHQGMKASLVPVNTNYRYGPEEVTYLFDNAQAEAVVFHSAFAPLVDQVRARPSDSRSWPELACVL